jgi:hypothetical protein
VIEASVGWEYVENASAGTGLGIGRTVDDSLDPSMDDGPGAHDTGLQGDIENGAGEAVVADPPGGVAQCRDLGMGGGIGGGDGAIPTLADDRAVAYQERAHRDLAFLCRTLGEIQCTGHIASVVGWVGRLYSHSIVPGGLPVMS